MVLARFQISLDNADATYFAGQEVTGIVHIWSDKPKNVTGIYVECQGFARVQFSRQVTQTRTVRDSHGRSRTESYSQRVHYKSEEKYFDQKIIISDRGNTCWELESGQHQYPFSFILPDAIPPSFEGVHGHIRYTVRAVYQRRLKLNHECKAMFAVSSIVDLNAIPASTNPVQASDFKTLGIWCCKSNPITVKFWLEKTGYVSGQTIYFNAEVENLSRRKMRGSNVQLIEKTQFYAMGEIENHQRVICRNGKGSFKTSELWENHPITLPPLLPSDLKLCRIIDLSYEITFIVDPGPLSFNLSLTRPIIIGNVPLSSSSTNPLDQQGHRQLPANANNDVSTTVEEIGNSNDLPLPCPLSKDQHTEPPTYEEALRDSGNSVTNDK